MTRAWTSLRLLTTPKLRILGAFPKNTYLMLLHMLLSEDDCGIWMSSDGCRVRKRQVTRDWLVSFHHCEEERWL